MTRENNDSKGSDDPRKTFEGLAFDLVSSNQAWMGKWIKDFFDKVGGDLETELGKLLEKNSADELLKHGLFPTKDMHDQLSKTTTEAMAMLQDLVSNALAPPQEDQKPSKKKKRKGDKPGKQAHGSEAD